MGGWPRRRLDELFARLLGNGVDRFAWASPAGLASRLRQRFAKAISPERAFEVGRGHYDLGNDLFLAMLDRSMTYSCAYWQGAADLDAAQEAKLDLVCRKIGVRPGERVLDVGCGWGSLARHAGGANYDRTLLAWHDNFTRRWPDLHARYAERRGGRFERIWRYYLLACAGAFRAGALDIWQLVLAREPRAYQAVR